MIEGRKWYEVFITESVKKKVSVLAWDHSEAKEKVLQGNYGSSQEDIQNYEDTQVTGVYVKNE
jgi:hypothetical protein